MKPDEKVQVTQFATRFLGFSEVDKIGGSMSALWNQYGNKESPWLESLFGKDAELIAVVELGVLQITAASEPSMRAIDTALWELELRGFVPAPLAAIHHLPLREIRGLEVKTLLFVGDDARVNNNGNDYLVGFDIAPRQSKSWLLQPHAVRNSVVKRGIVGMKLAG